MARIRLRRILLVLLLVGPMLSYQAVVTSRSSSLSSASVKASSPSLSRHPHAFSFPLASSGSARPPTPRSFMHENSDALYTLRVLYQTSRNLLPASLLHQQSDDNNNGDDENDGDEAAFTTKKDLNGTGTATTRCTFPNFCAMEKHVTSARICNRRGTCRFDVTRCRYWCDCDRGYAGQKCETETEADREIETSGNVREALLVTETETENSRQSQVESETERKTENRHVLVPDYDVTYNSEGYSDNDNANGNTDTKSEDIREPPPPSYVVPEIFNETAFGVVDHDYEYAYSDGGWNEEDENEGAYTVHTGPTDDNNKTNDDHDDREPWRHRRGPSAMRQVTEEACEIVDRSGGAADGKFNNDSEGTLVIVEGVPGASLFNNCPSFFPCVHGVCKTREINGTEDGHGASTELWCECDGGWVGERCEMCCNLQCGEHGHCTVSTEHGKLCQCQWEWEGEYCEVHVKPPTVPPSHTEGMLKWIAIGVGIFALLALLSLPVMIYYMWKNRVYIVMKILWYFQPYEDDDEKEYDVFVSYRSCPRDESFVVHHLYPKLELEHNFRCCLHFRDFEPGETIANNIIRAIHSSRRTILLLSPSYVTSEWARFEYQVAQHEMLKLRHRIIPIILDDISNVTDMDANLEAIMRSVTYIRYPGVEDSKKEERFWRKIILSLPKKRGKPPAPEVAVTSSSTSGVAEAVMKFIRSCCCRTPMLSASSAAVGTGAGTPSIALTVDNNIRNSNTAPSTSSSTSLPTLNNNNIAINSAAVSVEDGIPPSTMITSV